MKKLLLLAIALATQATFAHPGRTASDGCHYCRTNCGSWGVPWNERHCHYKEDFRPPEVTEGTGIDKVLPINDHTEEEGS